MTIPSNPQSAFSPFLPTTYNFPEDEERLKVFLIDIFGLNADVTNDKKIGIYEQAAENSVLNGEKWWYKNTKINRNGYQAISFIQSLPNAGVLVLTRQTNPQYFIANVNPECVFTMLYGIASRPPTSTGAGNADYFQFNNRGDPRITFDVSDTTITVTTTVDLTLYSCFLVVHYLRNGL